ncbi:MAG: zinc dependent phospholipase C family protein [Terriglobales bacterium]
MQDSRSWKQPKSGTARFFHVRKRYERYFTSRVVALLFCAITFSAPNSQAYSVLTHEELIDLAWVDSIRPLLLAKFPGATEEQLREAHAYAYGGSAVQDMGYYPFGKQFFSNLTHYVRSGDFVAWLLSNARSLDEYAFAIGALSHYVGDSIGHSEAVNLATAVEFPKLAKAFGPSVTYDESPHGHIRTEFAFDIAELSDADFPSGAYLRHIGFKVPRKFLEEAFQKTYGFDIHEVLGRAHPALRSYRTSVRSFIPAFAEAEVVLHRHQFPPHVDSETDRVFRERLARTTHEGKWKQKGPGVKAHLLAVLVFVVPKIGSASDLAIKIPDPQTYEMYQSSVNHAVDIFRDMLRKLDDTGDEVKLANIDLDTGNHVKRGEYPLADATYAQLLERLTSKPDRVIPASTKQNLMTYYGTTAAIDKPNAKRDEQLATLRMMKAGD